MGRRASSSSAVAVAALSMIGTACRTAGSVPEVELDPLQVSRPRPTPLEPVSFLAGCWQGTSTDGTTVIEERWTPPSQNVMVGTTRYLRGDTTVGFEFGHLEAAGDSIILTPYPGGRRSDDTFRLTRRAAGEVVFEAPEHDYPKRILYRRSDEGGLDVRIDAGSQDPAPRGWSLASVRCEGLPGT